MKNAEENVEYHTVGSTKFELPRYAGAFYLNEDVSFSLKKKPNFIHRFFFKICFGLIWKDDKSHWY